MIDDQLALRQPRSRRSQAERDQVSAIEDADHDQRVDQEGRRPLADVGELEAEVDALGRDELRAAWRRSACAGSRRRLSHGIARPRQVEIDQPAGEHRCSPIA